MKQTEYTVFPERIVAFSGIENAQTLLKEKPLQIGLGREEVAVLKNGAYLILDFGREIVGGVRILNWFSGHNVPIRLRFGESVSETCAEIGEKNATNEHALRDFRLDLSWLSDGVYGSTGFRFLRIDTFGEIQLKSVVAVDRRTDLPEIGSFTCNDARINEIWRVSKDTLFACVQNGYIWDGVKRDRLVWIGDLHPETLGLLAVSGGVDNVENCLRFVVDQTPLPDWMNGIPAYSMWWIINLHDYIAHTGKVELLEEFKTYFHDVLAQCNRYVEEDGTTHFPYDFLDWPTHEQPDEIAGQAGVILLAAEKGEVLSDMLGIETAAGEIKRKLLRRKDSVKISKEAEAMRVLAGAVSPQEAADFLAQGGSRGLSTFMSYYIFRALAEGGKGKEALSAMREFYGAMLDRGARTFWEDFSMDWLEGSGRIDELPRAGIKDLHGDHGAYCYIGFRHSLCHGWACGPIPFLAHIVLGVRILEPGCKKIAVVPDLCGLTHAEGVYPTPQGPLRISHTVRGDGSIESKIEAPEGVEIVTEGTSLLA